MKRNTRVIISSFTAAALIAQAAGMMTVSAEGKDDIVILYTNDIHCGIDQGMGFDGLSALKKETEKNAAAVALIDCGDMIQGEMIGLLSRGEDIIDLANAVGYDAAIPGNHEFDYGTERFLELTKKSDYPWLCCNLIDSREDKTVFEPYMIKEMAGKRIGIIGAVTPTTFTTSTPRFFKDEEGHFIYSFLSGKDGTEFYEAVQNAVDEVHKQNVDLCILAAHLGIDESAAPFRSTDLIEHTTGIDVVLDGHSHSTVETDKVKNKDGKEVLLSQTGTKLQAVGKLTVSDSGLKTELITDHGEKDSEITALMEEKQSGVKDIIEKKWGHTEYELAATKHGTKDWLVRNQETNLGDFVADAYKYVTDAEIGLVNGGSLRANVEKGDITFGDINTVVPFNNGVAKKIIKGQDIADGLEFSIRSAPANNGGFLHVSGITFDVDLSKTADIDIDSEGFFRGIAEGSERRISNIKVNGEPLDPQREYVVGSNEYVLVDEGDGNTGFAGEMAEYSGPRNDAAAVAAYLESLGGEVPERYADINGEGRMNFISSDSPSLTTVSEETAAFSDTKGHWAADTISRWKDSGIISGYPDGSFRPDAPVTRAELSKILAGAYSLTEKQSLEGYTGIDPNAWYYPYVECAVKYVPTYAPPIVTKATEAYGQGNDFLPDENAIRVHAAEALVRIKEDRDGSSVEVPEIHDVQEELEAKYKDDDFKNLFVTHTGIADNVRRMFEYSWLSSNMKLIEGDTDGYFRPCDTITRAELLTIIDRAGSAK